MFETLEIAPPDSILGLTEAFKQDPNPEKINLSVGVYQNDEGTTPILNCVQEAETRLAVAARSRSYLPIGGSAEFCRCVLKLLNLEEKKNLAATVQTPGGTGGLRVAADFLHSKYPQAKMWISRPTWANHNGIFSAAGMKVESYRYLADDNRTLDFSGLIESLKNIPRGDVVCLHGCCHNPSGVDPSLQQWQEIAALLKEREILPLVDFAYQGFGQGLDEDTAGLSAVLSAVPEALVCSSFSKNFGLYSERVGALSIVASSPEATAAALSHVKLAIRTNYSNPPLHGAAVVATVLQDAGMRSQWEQELAAMRGRIHRMRERFVAGMQEHAPGRDFSFISRQNGMFSFSGLTPLQVDQLRGEHAIYIVGSGRINVAGINDKNLPRLCQAIAGVL